MTEAKTMMAKHSDGTARRLSLRTLGTVTLAWLAILAGPSAQTQTFTVPQGRVENVAWSRDGTTFTVTYDLVAADANAVFEVQLQVLMNGAPFAPSAVAGDVGTKIKPGTGKKISWESAKDTDNQNFDQFKFTVMAESGRAEPVASSKDPPAPAPPSEPAFAGSIWRGTYAGEYPAQLIVERHEAPAFSGVIAIVTKTGEPATEVAVEGTLDRGIVIFSEISVRDRGAERSWNLGSASGTYATSGQRMGGAGNDRRRQYQWTFSRVAGAQFDPLGRWQGEYAGDPAQLMIDRIDGTAFTGRLIVTTRRGRETTEIEVSGTIVNPAITVKEVRLVRLGAAGEWNLGAGQGTLGSGGMQLIGEGNDGRKSYRWFFVREGLGG
jgi:hypothetical protein